MPLTMNICGPAFAALALGALLVAAPCNALAQRAEGAPAARIDSVIDQHHGVAVPDPYRYLEDVKRPEVQAWMQAQSDATAKLLASIDGRDALAARIAEVTAAAGDRITNVMRLPGERYYYLKRGRGERQFRLVLRQGLDRQRTHAGRPRGREPGHRRAARDQLLQAFVGRPLRRLRPVGRRFRGRHAARARPAQRQARRRTDAARAGRRDPLAGRQPLVHRDPAAGPAPGPARDRHLQECARAVATRRGAPGRGPAGIRPQRERARSASIRSTTAKSSPCRAAGGWWPVPPTPRCREGNLFVAPVAQLGAPACAGGALPARPTGSSKCGCAATSCSC